MKELTVKGLVTVEGMKFHEIEGGFGEDKKSMLVKEIAAIHGREEKHLNEVINNNIKRFAINIDIINLLSDENFKVVVDDLGLKSSNRQKYAYLLSERGYSKLLKLLDDDIAWEQYDKLVDGYFNMRKAIKEKSPDLMIAEAIKTMVDTQAKQNEQIIKLIENQNKLTEQVKDITENYKMLCVITDGQWESKKKTSSLNGNKKLPSITDIVKNTSITPPKANETLIKKGILYIDKNGDKRPTPEAIERGICEEDESIMNPGHFFARYTTKGQKEVKKILGIEEVEQTTLDNVIEFKK